MNNYVQEGDTVGVTAPYALTSGAGCLVGSLFGVSTGVYANGAAAQIKTRGVCTVAKVSAQAWTQGVLIYWDDTAKLFTTVSTSNKIVGVATLAAANPTSTGTVRLNGAALS